MIGGMNISEALVYGRFHLPSSPEPDARLLLQHTLNRPHSYLLAHADNLLTPAQETMYRQLVERAMRHEPIPYILGYAPFYGLEFVVNSAVLIPRPETEQLVETVVQWAKPKGAVKVVDIGTGSGCIAVTLARLLPQASIGAVDISGEALVVAQQNGRIHAPGRIQFHQGSLLLPLNAPVDAIVANLPYVTDSEWTQLDDGIKLYEPATALQGGPDGLDVIRELLTQATTRLKPGGAIFLEIGWQQGQKTKELGEFYFPQAHIEVLTDFSGHDRIVTIYTI